MKNKLKKYLLSFVCSAICFVALAQTSDYGVSINTAEDYYLKGKEFLRNDEYEEANKAFMQAQKILKDVDVKPHTQVSRVDVPSEGVIIPAVTSVVDNPLERAKEAYYNEDFKNAKRFYEQALEKYPKNHFIHYNLGVLHLRLKEYNQAAEEFKKVVLHRKKDADSYYNLGVIYENYINDRRNAVKCYKKYVKYSSAKRQRKVVQSWIDGIENQHID
ncbi:MAG: tetratricopeptide repeat protein [Candidatus Omnitrophica bacterium]|nr:tetratricopeptide repeat protein [Candidatus Omnitrophota bacterium]